MKKVIIGIVVLLLLGGGAGAWLFLGGDDKGEEAEVSTSPPVFVKLNTLMVPVIRRNRIEGHITIDVSIEVPDQRSKAKVEMALVRLRDAFLTELQSVIGRRRLDGRSVYLPEIKKRLTIAAKRVVGAERVRGVLVQSVFERDLG